jgi:DNA topoisomerase-3
MTKLYICEKASVGRALAGVLPGAETKGDNFIQRGGDVVAWASGHLLELCEPEDYDERYKKWEPSTLLYVPERWKRKEISRTKALLSGIKKLLKDANTVVNVGDADREGQLLIDEILEYCGWKGKTLRLRVNDMNPEAIRKALGNIRANSEFRGESMAGQARMYADWLVGLALTRYVTVSLRNAGYKAEVMSVGRVQTPTLGLVAERDREIENFSPSPYYELTAVLSLDENRKLEGGWIPKDADSESLDSRKRITDREFAGALVKKLDGAEGAVTSVTKKAHKVSPPLPYSLSKLQMEASKKHDITDTLVHVQKLYESGYVTYPRTGCEYIPEGHFLEAGKTLDAIRAGCPGMADMLAGADKTRKGPAWNDKKITEHHAIVPTARVPADGALSEKERKIYELICARYALQFLADVEYEETTVEFSARDEVFRTTGRTVLQLGWRGWDGDEPKQKGNAREEADEDEGREADTTNALPPIRQDETGIIHAAMGERMTHPPKPFTYHGLIQAMNGIYAYVKTPEIRAKLKESRGIGTEATQEGIIAVLFKRGYLEKKKKIIASTELGRTLIDILSSGKAAALTRPDITALWERTMSGIEAGSVSLESFVAEVAGMVREIVSDPLDVPAQIPGMERREKREESGETVEAPCPLNCGGNARRCSGKFGYYWRCSCSTLTFKDADGRPAVREARAEALCLVKGCSGKAVRLMSKKDSRLFWKCGKCGNFFDDADGGPKLRESRKKKADGGSEKSREAAL